jgi:murein DD-endopeptidase MepM/ murein hydrolase activator NlpD
MRPAPATPLVIILTTTVLSTLATLTPALQPPVMAATTQVSATGTWPLAPPPNVVATFAAPPSEYAAGHRGVDLAGRAGQTVRAALPGTVSFAGRIAGRGVVVVEHGETRTTYEPVTAAARVGTTVAAGTAIGTLELFGSHCFPSACLHWGWLRGEVYLDPLGLVSALRVRLLPLGGLAPPEQPLGPRVRLLIGPAQPVGGYVGVQLRRRQGGVSQDLLDGA